MMKIMECRIVVVMCMSLLATSIMTTSCCKDHDSDKMQSTDTNAGTFAVSNVSYNESVNSMTVKALNGDTLKVLFTPKPEYRNERFNLECSELKKLNDSLFVVKDMDSGEHEMTLSAVYSNETDTLITNHSKTERLTVQMSETYVIMPYKVGVSSDLLEFVDAEVTYTDADGTSHSYIISKDQWVRSDSITCQFWKDSEEKSHFVEVGKDEVESGWTLEDEMKVLPTPYYSFKVRYYHVGISSNVTVRYIPKSNTPERESYDFYHKLIRLSSEVHVPNVVYIDNSISIDIKINIGGDGKIRKEQVYDYINHLVKTPDVIKLKIDPAKGILREEQ